MEENGPSGIDYLDAVTRAAQYLASMQPGANRWVEFGKVVSRFFHADLVAIGYRAPGDQVALSYSNLVDREVYALLLDAVRRLGPLVLDSGFLSTEIIAIPASYAVALLPLAPNKKFEILLIVGHRGDEPLPTNLLDIYLAVARLMESTLARLGFEEQMRLRAREQACVAALGHRALEGAPTSILMKEAVARIAKTMEADYCALFELLPDEKNFLLRAGFGWSEGSVGRATVEAGPHTQPGFTLHTGRSMAEDNVDAEKRFVNPPFFRVHNIASSVTVTLAGRGRPKGVMSVHTAAPRIFKDEEINFLQSAANVVAAAWERKQADMAILRLNEELEARVRQRTSALEEALQELQDINYSVSHDLRTPLRAVDGFARILLTEYGAQLDHEGRRLLNVVRDNAQTMGRLIDDLLAFSQVGRVKLVRSRLDMTALAQSAWQERQDEIAQRPVEFRLTQLPPATGDRALLRDVFARLLDNALKFTRGMDPTVIEVDGRVTDAEHIYAVRDNGIGFDMRFVGKLFGVFQRLHPEQPFEGTGIGLAVVKRIVNRHGGRVWAEGQPGKGASFYFALPAEEKRHD